MLGPLSQNIPDNGILPTSYIQHHNATSMFVRPVTEQEIRNIIRELRNSSPGSDDVPPFIIKDNANIVAPIMTHIMNLSLNQGVFPHEMKCAKVIPLFKAGNKLHVNNYRPISLLPCLSKIIEKCMAAQLTDYLSKYNILYRYQFGFRAKHSSNIALNLLVDKIVSSLDKKEAFVGVALDFRKAFDTIDFTILLSKLYKYGIRSTVHNWFKEYLMGRSQFVSLNNVSSSMREILCGVPQGSILGPLLFLLYINDLPFSSNLLPIIYADDTNLFLSDKDVNICIQRFNYEMIKINEWIVSNKLSLNINKTNFIVFSRGKKLSFSSPITINGTPIKQVSSLKFLGIFLDEKLTWSQHINHIRGKISRSVGMLSSAKRFLERETLIKLYYAFIYPYITYCIEVWGHCNQQLFQSLFKIQKRAIRTITSSGRLAHTAQLFDSLNILPMKSIYMLSLSSLMYKYHFRLLPPVVDELFITNASVHSINTRQQLLLHIPRIQSKLTTQSLRYRGSYIWNQILQSQYINIYNTGSLHQFKREMQMKLGNGSITIHCENIFNS